MRISSFVFFLIIFLSLFSIVCIADDSPLDLTNSTLEHKLILFYSETCPHCHEERLFLDSIRSKYPELIIEEYEVSQPGVVDKLVEMAENYGFKPRGVPVTFVNNNYFIGFDSEDKIGKQIEDAIVECISTQQQVCDTTDQNIVNLPFFGEIDAKKISLPIFTVIIGGLDGFNPCAMWVLTFLLSLLLYAKSRKKMLLIGTVFVITSGAIYFLFMTAWLNFFLLVGYVTIMRVIIAIIAITAGLINVKELFWFKKGVSLTIDEKQKPKIFEKMRKVVHEQQLSIAILGTIALAVFVNFIELLCTAGLPAIYTNILVQNDLSSLTYYLYLMLYNIIYIIPLMVIVAVFVLTMGRHKFTERQGKMLKLISGLLMLLLGLIMLIRPELLNFV